MKTYMLVVVLVALYSAVEAAKYTMEEAKVKLLTFGKECADETGATAEDIEKLLQKTVPDSTSGKCLINCVYKKLGVMKDGKYHPQGGIDASALVHEHNEELMKKVKEISSACEAEAKGADECEIAANVMACNMRMAKEHDLLSHIPV